MIALKSNHTQYTAMTKNKSIEITNYTNQLKHINNNNNILYFFHNDHINNYCYLTKKEITTIFSEINMKLFLDEYFKTDIKNYDNPITAVMIYILTHNNTDNKTCKSFISSYAAKMPSTFELPEYFIDVIVSQITTIARNIDLNHHIQQLTTEINNIPVNNNNNNAGHNISVNNANVAKKSSGHPYDKISKIQYCISYFYNTITYCEWKPPISNQILLSHSNLEFIQKTASNMERLSFIPAYLNYANFINKVASFIDIEDQDRKKKYIEALIEHIILGKKIKDRNLEKYYKEIANFLQTPSNIKKHDPKMTISLIMDTKLIKPVSLIEEHLTFSKIQDFSTSDQDYKKEIIQNTLDKINDTINPAIIDDNKSLVLLKLYNINHKEFSAQNFIEWFMAYVYDLKKLTSAQQQKIYDCLNTLWILIKKAPDDNYEIATYTKLTYKNVQSKVQLIQNNPNAFYMLDMKNNNQQNNEYKFDIAGDPFCQHKHTITITATNGDLKDLNDHSKIEKFISDFLATILKDTLENTKLTSVGEMLNHVNKDNACAYIKNYEILKDGSLSFDIIANLGK